MTLPYVKGSETSKAAAESMEKPSPSIRDRVWRMALRKKEHGITDDEVEHALDLRHQTASARRRELVQLGVMIDSGRTRKTRSGRKATVWVALWPEAPPQQASLL